MFWRDCPECDRLRVIYIGFIQDQINLLSEISKKILTCDKGQIDALESKLVASENSLEQLKDQVSAHNNTHRTTKTR